MMIGKRVGHKGASRLKLRVVGGGLKWSGKDAIGMWGASGGLAPLNWGNSLGGSYYYNKIFGLSLEKNEKS